MKTVLSVWHEMRIEFDTLQSTPTELDHALIALFPCGGEFEPIAPTQLQSTRIAAAWPHTFKHNSLI